MLSGTSSILSESCSMFSISTIDDSSSPKLTINNNHIPLEIPIYTVSQGMAFLLQGHCIELQLKYQMSAVGQTW